MRTGLFGFLFRDRVRAAHSKAKRHSAVIHIVADACAISAIVVELVKDVMTMGPLLGVFIVVVTLFEE